MIGMMRGARDVEGEREGGRRGESARNGRFPSGPVDGFPDGS